MLILDQDADKVKIWRCPYCGNILLYTDKDLHEPRLAVEKYPYLICSCGRTATVFETHYVKLFNNKENINNE